MVPIPGEIRGGSTTCMSHLDYKALTKIAYEEANILEFLN